MRLREAIHDYKRRKVWDAAEVNAGQIMISSISPSVLSRISGHAGSIKQIWEALQREYMGTNFILADTELERLHNVKYDEFGSATSYVQYVKTLVDLLKDMGILIPDFEHSHILLKGLGESFRDVIISLRGDTRAGEPEILGERIISAENNIQKEQKAALPSANIVRDSSGCIRTKKCKHCGRAGHDDKECWIKHPHLRPRRRKQGKRPIPASSQSESRINETQKEGGQGPSSSTARINIVSTSPDRQSRVSKDTTTWILDSGATAHICGQRAAFQRIRPFNKQIITATGEEVAVQGIGGIRLTLRNGRGCQALFLRDVLYVPGIQMNLMSTGKLNDMGTSVIHQPGVTILQRGNRVLGRAHLVDGLFRLSVRQRPTTARHQHVMSMEEVEPMETTDISLSGGVLEAPHTAEPICHQNSAKQANSNTPSDVVSEELWHMRLGHINYPDVEKVLEDTGTEYCRMTSEERKALPRCPACMLGKMTRRRFNRKKKPSIHSHGAFELIHADTAEMPISPQGFRYFIQFTDDYSRGTWAYPMKSKAESLARLK